MERARASYERCCIAPQFFESFYNDFLEACPEAGPMFANTDFEQQHKLLQHAIGLLLVFPGQPESERGLLKRVAERHSRRDLNVDPSLYEAFVESLIETVRKYDAEFNEEIEEAWRKTLAPGVEYMKSHY